MGHNEMMDALAYPFFFLPSWGVSSCVPNDTGAGKASVCASPPNARPRAFATRRRNIRNQTARTKGTPRPPETTNKPRAAPQGRKQRPEPVAQVQCDESGPNPRAPTAGAQGTAAPTPSAPRAETRPGADPAHLTGAVQQKHRRTKANASGQMGGWRVRNRMARLLRYG